MASISFGELIKKMRTEAKLTSEDLANKVGIDRTYLSKIENKDYFPSLKVFIRLASILNINLSDFDFDKYVVMPDIRNWDEKRNPDQLVTPQDIYSLIEKKARSLKTKPEKEIPPLLKEIINNPETKNLRKSVINFLKKFKPSYSNNKNLIKKLTRLIKQLKKTRSDFAKKDKKQVIRIKRLIWHPEQFSLRKK